MEFLFCIRCLSLTIAHNFEDWLCLKSQTKQIAALSEAFSVVFFEEN
jgi:hypothetical protein